MLAAFLCFHSRFSLDAALGIYVVTFPFVQIDERDIRARRVFPRLFHRCSSFSETTQLVACRFRGRVSDSFPRKVSSDALRYTSFFFRSFLAKAKA